jgi:hypothetical protein
MGDFALLNVEINRKISTSRCRFTDHFKEFKNVEAVQRIFGDNIEDVLTNLPIQFTDETLYMEVDYDGRILINPEYFQTGDDTDLYPDVIHELVHVKQVMHGKNCNHKLRYIERPLEIDAYRTAVEEARALGLDEDRILDYLESDLIDADELKQLAETLGVGDEEAVLEDNN